MGWKVFWKSANVLGSRPPRNLLACESLQGALRSSASACGSGLYPADGTGAPCSSETSDKVVLSSTAGWGSRTASLSSAAGSSGLPAHICRLCGSHNHPFPLTASQTIKEPPSPSSCLWGRSSCRVTILEGEVSLLALGFGSALRNTDPR